MGIQTDHSILRVWLLLFFFEQKTLEMLRKEKATASTKIMLYSIPAQTEKRFPVFLSHVLNLLHLIYY